MNGNESNNQNNQEGLNVVSLGSVEGNGENLNIPINDISPVEPVESLEPMETLENPVSNESNVEEPVLDIHAVPTMDTVEPVEPVAPVEPLNYDIPDVINTTPVFNDIGTIPPISNVPEVVMPVVNENKAPKKKGMNKTLFVLIIILALALVGGGVYLLLNKANGSNAPAVILKSLKIEIGSSVSTDKNDYATFRGIDSSTCSLDTSEIKDTNVLNAEYKFKIICNDKTYTGKAVIVDTVVPEITLKEVTVGVNGTVNPGDFISQCDDKTECSYEFKDATKVQEYLKEVASYHVPILVKDEAGNEKEVTGTLNVVEEVSTVALICMKTSNGVLETNKFGLVGSEFNQSTTRSYTYSFASEEDYNQFKSENMNKTEITYQNVTGSPEFDDVKHTLILTKKVTYEELKQEAGASLPLPYGELKSFYENKGYQCKVGY